MGDFVMGVPQLTEIDKKMPDSFASNKEVST